MMEFFLIYLMVMCEAISGVLDDMGFMIFIGFLLLAIPTLIAAFNSTDLEDFQEGMENPVIKKARKWGIVFVVVGVVLVGASKLIPDQKNLAIIVGAGVTYQAVTSETGKRIGGKAVDLLEQKISEALDEPKLIPQKKVEKIADGK
jgi:hypothetical protein